MTTTVKKEGPLKKEVGEKSGGQEVSTLNVFHITEPCLSGRWIHLQIMHTFAETIDYDYYYTTIVQRRLWVSLPSYDESMVLLKHASFSAPS